MTSLYPGLGDCSWASLEPASSVSLGVEVGSGIRPPSSGRSGNRNLQRQLFMSPFIKLRVSLHSPCDDAT